MHLVLPNFDAVIIGAGPAGASMAIRLARAGWSVALIEKQGFPRRKVCGECIAASNLRLLHDLGIGPAFDASAGPALRRVTLLHGDRAATARLPAAEHERFPWGRALGRETLDELLLAQARAAGAVVFQPCTVRSTIGKPGAWQCDVRALDNTTTLCLRAAVLIDAHGSWEALPSQRAKPERCASDLFAFKANFRDASLAEGAISVLALNGGYGGIVLADGGIVTIACCIRRDRLAALRNAAPGLCAGDVVEAWLAESCSGVRDALNGAVRDGPWLSSGPLAPGIRVRKHDTVFRVGNAAGEAHPILGEGMSMALQSAAMLSAHLLENATQTALVPSAQKQAELQRRYVAAWRMEFAPRLRVAALFAHLAMRPFAAALLMKLVQAWPGLLTHGARWGGKVRQFGFNDAPATSSGAPAIALQVPQHSLESRTVSPRTVAPRTISQSVASER